MDGWSDPVGWGRRLKKRERGGEGRGWQHRDTSFCLFLYKWIPQNFFADLMSYISRGVKVMSGLGLGVRLGLGLGVRLGYRVG